MQVRVWREANRKKRCRRLAVTLTMALLAGQVVLPVCAEEEPVSGAFMETTDAEADEKMPEESVDGSEDDNVSEEGTGDLGENGVTEEGEGGSEENSVPEEGEEAKTETVSENSMDVDEEIVPLVGEPRYSGDYLGPGEYWDDEHLLKFKILSESEKEVEVMGWKYDSDQHTPPLTVPAKVLHGGEEYHVIGIGISAFLNCKNIPSVTIEDGIRYVGNGAFYDCYEVPITMADSITSVGNNAFRYCRGLTSIPSGLQEVGDHAFCGTSVATADLSLCATIGDYAFSEWPIPLQEVKLSEQLTEIGNGVFWGCTSLNDIAFPEGLTSIGEDAFRECRSFQNVKIPAGVTQIGDRAFYYCVSLTTVELPPGLSTISKGLFMYCNRLTDVNIPENVSRIDSMAFGACKSLESIAFPASVKEMNQDSFRGADNLRELVIYVDDVNTMVPIKMNEPEPYKGDLSIHAASITFKSASTHKVLTGKAFEKARDVYLAVDDGDKTDQTWYGWTINGPGETTIYSITASATAGGRIDPNGTVAVEEGDDQTFTMTSDEGYRIKSVTVDGNDATWEEAVQTLADDDQVQTGKAGTYTFPNVQADHTIGVFFEMVNGSSGSNDTGGGNNGQSDSDTAPDAGVTEAIADGGVRVEISTDAEITAAVADTPASAKTASEKEPRTDDASRVEIYATIAMIAGFTYLLLYFMEERRGMSEREKEVFVAAFIRWAKKGGKFRKCCALVAIFCILVYYHSIGKRGEEKLYPVLRRADTETVL